MLQEQHMPPLVPNELEEEEEDSQKKNPRRLKAYPR
jgi:hypothetical protein